MDSKPNLHIVETNWDELEKKIRQHRMRRLRRILLVVLLCGVAFGAFYFFVQNKAYDEFVIMDEVSRSDTAATHYIGFQKGYIKYSNDGISYVTSDGTVLWNQSYGMENPMVATCESYVTVADREGETIYIMNTDEIQCEIAVTMPIVRVDVASQGTVAVLMEENSTGYLALYDKAGELLAEGAVYMENSGTPVDIALSTDGKNLSVSIVDISGGVARTVLNFYNFGATGQNQIDNLTGTITYEDTILPNITYVSDSRLVAFGDNGVYVFSASGTPAEAYRLEVEDEIQSIFYDENYFGLVFVDVTKDAGRILQIYDTTCKEIVTIETEFSYDTIGFLNNHEICMYNSNECKIFTLRGLEKFAYTFDSDLAGIFCESGWRTYYILEEGVTKKVRLKLFDDIEELWGFLET